MPAETECFVWLAGDNLYTGSRSKWKLQINKIACGVDQQAKKWMLSHTRCHTCLMLEAKPPPTHPLIRWTDPKVWVLTARLFHFITVWFHSKSNCISMAQWSIQSRVCVFSPTPTKLSVSSSTSNEETIEMAERTINHQLRSDRRKRSTAPLGWHIFCGTGMETMLTLERLVWCSFCSLVPGWRLEWGTKNKKQINKQKN